VTGVAAVQGRIAELQMRFAAMSPVPRPPVTASSAPSTTSSTAPAAATTSPFAAELLAQLSVAQPAAPSSRPTGGADVDGERIVASATKHLGVPYVWGGTDPATGLDCSGLVQHVYREAGIELPRVSRDQARAGRPVASLAEARPGDLVAFGSPVDHIGIYAGDGKMVVAPRRGDVVKVQDVYRTPTAIRRILPDPAVAAPAPRPAALTGSAPYAHLFAAAGAKHGVSSALLTAVARAESAFDPRAVSPAGAQGLMQFMPATARELGVDPFDPASAVDGAARLLRSHLDRFGSLELALAAYNAGPGAVSRYGGVPPFAETQRYVQKILADVGGAA
jgi:peptidoglycan DL-endopeptidase CwlO